MQLSAPSLSLLLAISLLCLTGSVSAVNKIKCYSCTSETDPHCGDPLNTEGSELKAKECTNDLTNSILGGLNTGLKGLGNLFGLEKTPQIDANFVCLKTAYTHTTEDGKEKKLVLRSCALENSKICETLMQKPEEKGMKNLFCETCKTDDCNGSHTLRAAAFLIVPALAILLASH